MKLMSRYGLIVIVVISIIAAILFFLNSSNSVMPNLKFTDIDGKTHQLSDYKGKPILITFWATDCTSCIQEMPEMVSLYNKYSSKGFQMLSFAVSSDQLDHIKAMRKEKALPYLIAWDKNDAISKAFGNIRVTPTFFLISPKGQITMRKIGVLPHKEITSALNNMGITAKSS